MTEQPSGRTTTSWGKQIAATASFEVSARCSIPQHVLNHGDRSPQPVEFLTTGGLGFSPLVPKVLGRRMTPRTTQLAGQSHQSQCQNETA